MLFFNACPNDFLKFQYVYGLPIRAAKNMNKITKNTNGIANKSLNLNGGFFIIF